MKSKRLFPSAFASTMQLLTPDTGWALSEAKLFWTTDNGSHWKNITPHVTGHIEDVFFLDTSRGWVLLGSGDEETNLISFNVATTNDSGQSWSISHLKVPSQKPDELDGRGWLDFVDLIHGWVVLLIKTSSAFSGGLLLTTDDGGKTWKELPQAPVAGRPVFVTPQEGWLSGPAWAGRYGTHDGGKSWGGAGEPSDLPESVPTHTTFGDIRFTDAKHGFLPVWLSSSNEERKSKGTALIFYVTDDGARTWKRDRTLTDSDIGSLDHVEDIITLPHSVVIAMTGDKKHPNRLTLVTIGREGKVAHASSTLPLRTGDHVVQFSFVSPENGWLRTGDDKLLSTTDGGTAWKDISPTPTPQASVPTARPRKVKASLLGPGPLLVPQSPNAALHYTERLGFDTHNAPAIDVMGTWWDSSPFFDIGIYVGGANYCGVHNPDGTCKSRPDPNLNAAWITQAQAQGWGFFPLWIGPQAPCVNVSGYVKFTSANATAQGTSNADSAVAAMTALGLSGTVVFYDMENYTDDAQHVCSTAVRAFLTAWVREMNAKGFPTTAVYGNPLPAKNDFSQISELTQAWITVTPLSGQPPRITVWGLGVLSDDSWNTNERAHQFLINVPNVKYGGKTANPENANLSSNPPIDYDVENLQIPGGSGTKQYVWATDNLSPMPLSTPSVYAHGINDIFMTATGPAFVNSGQVGQVAGYWEDHTSAGCTTLGEYGCNYGFIENNLGVPTTIADPAYPKDTTVCP